MIQFRCSGCQVSFSVSEEKQGKKAKCPKCSEITQVPMLNAGGASPAPAPPVGSPKTTPTKPPTPTQEPVKLPRKPAAPRQAAPAARKPVPAAKPKRRMSDEQLREAVMGAFQGSFERPETKPFYVLGAAIVSVVMIALPMVYLSIIGLIGYAVYLHLTINGRTMLVRGNEIGTIGFALYMLPVVIAGVAIFFLIKPLFASPAEVHRTRSLTQKSDPLLFEFVAKICELVDAPFPTRIDVDDQMNASASFRRGIWSVIQGNDLVLTIGVPLAAGLTTRQFAGVLAHEFGHFSQGAGMRLTYVVRTISHWFARVAYERDVFDAWLWHLAESIDIRIAIFLYLFIFFIWIVRTILWILMYVGIFASGFLLRQMEYDADQYEIGLAGSAAFQQTSNRMRLIGAAYSISIELLSSVFQSGAMVDDITAFLKFQLQRFPDELKRDIRASIANESTGMFDTHPCDRERIAAAIEAKSPGVFQYEGLAVNLFGNFEKLSKVVTWDRYCQLTGSRLKSDELTPYLKLIDKYGLDIFGKDSEGNHPKKGVTPLHEIDHRVKIPFDE
ncbi:M48 family metalloprotease [Blastopirellula sp. J2-11]|uniref:M48 family metalloprotease n=1 Tax=Blastopirellula sp. J2-11 TaxID=2943192 RepID=UPI0021C5AB52|nr:M48 family metalloprotease [Blastopirellula sp. J2-11]UUO05060.1 M48 family metalloprotease [Blastopirellula sp. J2-11]